MCASVLSVLVSRVVLVMVDLGVAVGALLRRSVARLRAELFLLAPAQFCFVDLAQVLADIVCLSCWL